MVTKKIITRNTTCEDLFTSDELQCCCSRCYKKLDSLTCKRPSKQVKNRNIKNSRNKCEHQWDSSCATTTSKALRHKEACDLLGLPMDFILNDECKCGKETNEGKPCNSKKSSQ